MGTKPYRDDTMRRPRAAHTHIGGLAPRRVPIREWAHDPDVAYMSFTLRRVAPNVVDIHAATEHARAAGFRHVVTSAVTDDEAMALTLAGYSVRDELVVMARTLTDHNPSMRADGPVVERVRRNEDELILAVDRAAFASTWALDRFGLQEARQATPWIRTRVVRDDGHPVAYAICGLGRRRGYLQRLAVMPDHQGQGLGRQLVADSLGWLRRRRAQAVFVNTETTNTSALALYTATRFERQPTTLRTYERAL